MGSAAKFVTYLIVSAISVTCLVYLLINVDWWEYFGYNLGFILLIVGLIYSSYMFIYEIIKPEGGAIIAIQGAEPARNNVIIKNFMMDVYFKYLFCFSFSVLFFYVINLLRTNFEEYKKFPSDWFHVADIYLNLVLPIFCLCELMMNDRYRHHHYITDVMILLLIYAVHCTYRILIRAYYYKESAIVFPTIADYLMIYLISLNGFTTYDYSLYRKLNPLGNYILFA